MANNISLEEILNTYGSLNDLRAADGLSGDRRTLTTTDALSAILEKAYTADSLAGKTFFSGIVMATLPTGAPVFTSTRDNLEYLSRIKTQTNTSAPNQKSNLFFVYKVFVPEIDPRNILEEKSPNCMTLAQRINTLPDAVLAGAAKQSEALQAIQPGTLVDITFANEERFLNPKIVRVGPKLFDINLGGTSIKSKFTGLGPNSKPVVMGPRGTVSPNDPGTFSWSNRAKQQTAIYIPTGVPIYNGELERTGLLYTDPASGAKLIKDAKDDWLKLTAAYKRKFGKQLKGSGYRTYDSQVNVRMIRQAGDECSGNKYQTSGIRGEGAGDRNANCKVVGWAAIPGTSKHGWGSAVDIDRAGSGWTGGRKGNSPEFRWLNKFAPSEFNFNFGVRGEHWHLDWLGFNNVVDGVKVSTVRWTQAGVNDTSIVLV